jgi:hypothetical protein
MALTCLELTLNILLVEEFMKETTSAGFNIELLKQL